MEWRERNELVELSYDPRVHGDGLREAHAAVNDAVTDGYDAMLGECAASTPREEVLDRAVVPEPRPHGQLMLA
jgi:hypothetical protein